MTITLLRVDWSGNNTDGTTSSSFTFDDIESVNLKKDSEAKSSHGTIVLKNSYDRFNTGFTQPFTTYNANTNDIRFKEGDTIKIYVKELNNGYETIDTSSGSDDLLMSGEISEVNVKSEPNGAKITLKVVDKTYVILNRVHTEAFTLSDAKDSPTIIRDVIRKVTDDVSSDPESYDTSGNLVSNGIYAVDARLVSDGGFIEDTRQDGTAFPDNALAKIAKPAYVWVQDLSTIEATNNFDGRDGSLSTDDENAPTQDRNMIFYIDEQNRFHWFYPRNNTTTTLAEDLDTTETSVDVTDASNLGDIGTIFVGSERIDYTGKSGNTLTGCTRGANNTVAATHSNGDTVTTAISLIEGDTSSGYTLINYNLTKKTFDVINYVIFNCGQDMEGNGITQYFFDKATKSKSLKDTFKSYNDISKEMMKEEIEAGRITQDNTTTSPFFYNGNRYKETTGDYSSGAGITTAWGDTVTTDSGYNDSFRAEAIRQGKYKAQALTQRRGSPRWKGNMEFKFHRFSPGDLFEFTSTSAGLNKQNLRIKSVIYNITKSGAYTTLDVEEDETKLGET